MAEDNKILGAKEPGQRLWRDTYSFTWLSAKGEEIRTEAAKRHRHRARKEATIQRQNADLICEWIETQKRKLRARFCSIPELEDERSKEETQLRQLIEWLNSDPLPPDESEVFYRAEEAGQFFDLEEEFYDVDMANMPSSTLGEQDPVGQINRMIERLDQKKLAAIKSDPRYAISAGLSFELPAFEENHLVGRKLVTIKTPWAWIVPALIDGAHQYLAICPHCDSLFAKNRKNMKWCSDACGAAERYKRWYEQD